MQFSNQKMWDSLGSVWSTFQNKPLIEAVWSGINLAVDTVDTLTLETQKSRSLQYMSPTINMGPQDFTLVFSGLTTEVNVEPLSSGGSFYFAVDHWTYSIPSLTVDYKYRGTAYSSVYTEGVDYSISGLGYVVWGDTLPTPDVRYASTGTLVAYAPQVLRINPVLMDTWAKFCGFTAEYYASYDSFGQDEYLHLKMLIWALVYKQMSAPSIKTLRDAFAISRGMPFSYSAGTVTSLYDTDHYETTVADYTYTLPSGMVPVPDGTEVLQFDVLASGISLYTYKDNPTLVSDYSNAYNKNNTIVYKVSNTGATYDSTFHSIYVNKLAPVQLSWYQSGPYSMDDSAVLFNSTTIFMNEL